MKKWIPTCKVAFHCCPVCICFALILMNVSSVGAQNRIIDIDVRRVVELAQSEAPDVLLAETRLSNSYWQYQTFRSNFRPLINLSGEIPSLNRAIDRITVPDGSDIFIQRSLMSSGLRMSLAQDIAATGGSVYVSSGLNRLDVFQSPTSPGSVSWLSVPVSVGFIQPLFQFNALQWDKKIEPLRYSEAKTRYSEEMELVAYRAVELFFEVYRNQALLDGALLDKSNADTLYNISKGRFEVGRIAETDLLQIELQQMNANDQVAETTLRLQTSTERLRNFLGIKTTVNFRPVLDQEIPNIEIDPGLALSFARANRSVALAFARRLLEADRNVDQAERNNGFFLGLEGSIGLTQTSGTLLGAYQSPLDQERVSLSIQVPIADWGKAKARRETARSNRELIRMDVEQEQISFEQQILLRAQQFELIKNRVRLAARSLEVAKKGQEMTRERYMIGKIGIVDLTQAIQNLESARRMYIEAQREFWVTLYEIRGMTMYDFETNSSLIRQD